MLGEAGSADTKAAEEFPQKLKEIMEGKELSKIILIALDISIYVITKGSH